MWFPLLLLAPIASAQVTATGPNGPTNPDAPYFYPVGSTVNQQSESRLVTINSIDDWCMYGPMQPGPESSIGNREADVVAWCTKPRNGARIIPDGTVHAAQFIKTATYVQISGWWDGAKLNIPIGDSGGELDPHGATGEGNPVGGNLTTNAATGHDVFYEEWMMFVSYDQFCARICTAEENGVTAARQCDHIYDLMGCDWVMALGDDFYSMNGFESCDGDVAAAPGAYPRNGWTSTFYQGQQPTHESNCVQHASIANNINTNDWKVVNPQCTNK